MSINLLEENIGKNPHEIDLGSDFLGMTQKAQVTKQKPVNKIASNLKTFFALKLTINKVKRQVVDLEKYLQIIYPIET